MSGKLLLRGFAALLFSGIFAWVIFDRETDDGDTGRQRYLPYISGSLLPACVLAFAVCGLISFDRRTAAQMTLTFCFSVFLHICLYYLLLMPLLPVLRRHVSARACAVLWMLPNYLYLTQMSYMSLPRPLWVIEAPSALVWTVLKVWMVGFLGVLVWKITSHLLFRARILRGTAPVTDRAVLEVWQREVENARFRKPKFQLVSSPSLRTPLSVGLFTRSVRVVLPQRSYTPEELALIFRHELVHVGREDAWSKFFLVFCTAMCWFNPLMWVAMRKSAEDLELSCDETVLLDAGEDTKRQYADLLLKTAGDERGFTTCLSASAAALRYRLRSVVDTKKKPSGAFAVGLVFFLLCMSCGYVALAYGSGTGAELIYRSLDPAQFTLRLARWEDDPYNSTLVCTDEPALHRYLSSLPMESISGNYSFEPEGEAIVLFLEAPDGPLYLTLSDEWLEVVTLYGKRHTEYYYLPGGADRDTLRGCIVELPALNVHLTSPGDGYGRYVNTSPWRVAVVEGGSAKVVYERDSQETPNGIFGNYQATEASLTFNLPLVGDCIVEITPTDGGESRKLTLREAPTLPLLEEPARYTVRGEFLGRDGRLYQTEFLFEIGKL